MNTLSLAIRNQNPDLLSKLGVRQIICEFIAAQWQGHYQKAEDCYYALNQTDLTSLEQALVNGYMTLLQAKRGQALVEVDLSNLKKYPAVMVVYRYALFSRAFWVDHSQAWRALGHLSLLSIRLRWLGLFMTVAFLAGHLLTIRHSGRFGFLMAAYCYRRLTNNPEHIKFPAHIALATFAYTHVVARRLDNSFAIAANRGEQWLTPEPYYQGLLTVSCLYGYAYGGDVSRAEIYAARLKKLHQSRALLRYLPVSRIMPLLPLALRGYSHAIEAEFDEVVTSLNPDQENTMICSQFYRAAAVISLCLGRYQQAEAFAEKAVFHRQKTKSFHAWAVFDRCITLKAHMASGFLIGEMPLTLVTGDILPTTSASLLLSQLTSGFVQLAHQKDSTLYQNLADLIACSIDCQTYKLIDNPSEAELSWPFVKIGRCFVVYQAQQERSFSIMKQLAVIDPVLRVLFQARQSAKEQLEARVLRHMTENIFKIAHDIKSPLAALNTLCHHLEEVDTDKRVILTTAVERIHSICNDLLAKHRIQSAWSTCANYPETTTPREPANVAGTLTRLIQEKTLEYHNHSKSMTLTCPHHIGGLYINASQQEFMRVVGNLVNNAVEASKQPAEITILYYQRSDDVVIEISDKGCGIPEDQLPYVKEYGVSFGKNTGNGLGLYYAAEFAAQLAGSLDIESHRESGTTVRLVLPLHKFTTLVNCKRGPKEGYQLTQAQDTPSIDGTFNQGIERKSSQPTPLPTTSELNHGLPTDSRRQQTSLVN